MKESALTTRLYLHKHIKDVCACVYIKRTASDIDVSSRTSGLRYAVFFNVLFQEQKHNGDRSQE